MEITPRMVIKPPWEKWAKKKDQIVIEIDPGMAFGTGTHPSTQMCLQLLEELIPSFPKKPSLLDVGTGSGILSIAAHKLGIQKILAVDTDPVAIKCARANARANRIKEGVLFRAGSIDGLKRTFDLVVANLLPQEILSLADDLPGCVASQGLLILSGLLQKQKEEIAGVFVRHGFVVIDSRKSKGWASLVLKRLKALRMPVGTRNIVPLH
jgi:ribosomal protein L11 methyltransferase